MKGFNIPAVAGLIRISACVGPPDLSENSVADQPVKLPGVMLYCDHGVEPRTSAALADRAFAKRESVTQTVKSRSCT